MIKALIGTTIIKWYNIKYWGTIVANAKSRPATVDSTISLNPLFIEGIKHEIINGNSGKKGS